jgi:hypothetical protein
MADLTAMMQAAAGNAGGDATFIEDVFSCFLYTGNNSTQTITNGIDLSTKGGLIWTKLRTPGGQGHVLVDTIRGQEAIYSNLNVAEEVLVNGVVNFNTTGYAFTGGVAPSNGDMNNTIGPFVSWTFRKQPKFFNFVTYTGTGSNRTVAHALGSVPGCIMVKRTDTTGDWQVYHRANTANPETDYLVLNSTAATADSNTRWNDTQPTAAVFSLGTEATVNASGGTYVAYLFAHDAGGFGLTGTDNVISCGSFTTNGSGQATVNLGYEPQWLLVKKSNSTGDWFLADTMRGLIVRNTTRVLYANLDDAEASVNSTFFNPTSTGFYVDAGFDASSTFIYIAIRRGPMAVPELGTSVFGLSARSGTGANATVTGGAGVSDAVLIKNRGSGVDDLFSARLTGTGYFVTSASTGEVAAGTSILQANPWDVMDGVNVGTTSTVTNASSNTFINYLFDRAPGFFDVVCYTGTGTGTTVPHNLSAVPELMIVKRRNTSAGGVVYTTSTGNDVALSLNGTGSSTGGNDWNTTTPTSTVFSVGTAVATNVSGSTYIAYLFATCAGVSKVGSYTGNGTTQTINCGFGAGGARFVLIRRSDGGDWYVYDTARGMTLLTDPYFRLNDNSAETATLGSVTTVSTGFALDATVLAAINGSGNPYIFLAIA